MPDYVALASTAARLISEFGRSVTLRQTARTPGATPWNPSETATDYSITAVGEDVRTDQLDGTTVQAGDRRYTFAASGLAVTPEPDDEIVDDSIVWKIVAVEELKPGATSIIYRVVARR